MTKKLYNMYERISIIRKNFCFHTFLFGNTQLEGVFGQQVAKNKNMHYMRFFFNILKQKY